jgi:epoxide hydrolase 4
MEKNEKLENLITSQYISTNGIRLHCVSAGQGEPIILLHGFPEHWYSWRHQIPMLAQYGQVIAPDMRGYNLSEKPKGVGKYDVDILIEDIVGIIESTGAKKAIVMGHDWGGGIAWWLAIRRPGVVKKLIAMNCPHPMVFLHTLRGLDQLRKSWYMFFFQLPWLPELFVRGRDLRQSAERVFRGTSVQSSAFTDEDIDKFAAAMGQPGALTGMINYYRAAFRRPLWREKIPVIEVPTLLIWGEQDRFLVRRNTENMSQWVKDITVRFVPDSGHWVQQEKPDVVNQMLKEFITRD